MGEHDGYGRALAYYPAMKVRALLPKPKPVEPAELPEGWLASVTNLFGGWSLW